MGNYPHFLLQEILEGIHSLLALGSSHQLPSWWPGVVLEDTCTVVAEGGILIFRFCRRAKQGCTRFARWQQGRSWDRPYRHRFGQSYWPKLRWSTCVRRPRRMRASRAVPTALGLIASLPGIRGRRPPRSTPVLSLFDILALFANMKIKLVRGFLFI